MPRGVAAAVIATAVVMGTLAGCSSKPQPNRSGTTSTAAPATATASIATTPDSAQPTPAATTTRPEPGGAPSPSNPSGSSLPGASSSGSGPSPDAGGAAASPSAVAPPAGAAHRQHDPRGYTPYPTPGRGFTVECPVWMSIHDSADGFVGSGSGSELTVSAGGRSDADRLDAVVAALAAQGWATTQTFGDDQVGYTVVAGQGTQMLYVHTVIDNGRILRMRWTYPAAARADFDGPVGHVAATLRFA